MVRVTEDTLLSEIEAFGARLAAAERERDALTEALRLARHWHEQQDYDEALNVLDAALTPKEPTNDGE